MFRVVCLLQMFTNFWRDQLKDLEAEKLSGEFDNLLGPERKGLEFRPCPGWECVALVKQSYLGLVDTPTSKGDCVYIGL